MEDMQSRQCKKCGEVKDITEFKIAKKNKDGSCSRRRKCKACDNEEGRKYYHSNIEKCRAKNKRWRENNPEKQRERLRRWRRNNPERCRESNKLSTRQWRKKYPKKNKEIDRAYKKRHKEKIKERSKQCSKRAVIEMKDWYIKSLLKEGTDLKESDFTEEMIELKRLHLTINREIKRVTQ